MFDEKGEKIPHQPGEGCKRESREEGLRGKRKTERKVIEEKWRWIWAAGHLARYVN
jgi:hypothetical protein